MERSVTGGAFAKGPVFCGPSARRDASNGTAANPGAAGCVQSPHARKEFQLKFPLRASKQSDLDGPIARSTEPGLVQALTSGSPKHGLVRQRSSVFV